MDNDGNSITNKGYSKTDEGIMKTDDKIRQDAGMSNDGHSSINHSIVLPIDMVKLEAQSRERLSRALRRRYQYESNLRPAQEFLLEHVNSKIPLVIMYADLVGSTNMSMTLPASKMVTIIRSFSYEMSNIIHSHGGFVLKYVGDAVVAFFPPEDNISSACERSLESARRMISIIKRGINPVLIQEGYPELKIKIGIDEGESIIIQYGHDKISPIDILGYSMNKSAKITSLTSANGIMIGENIFNVLPVELKLQFREITFEREKWKYIKRETGQLFKLYTYNSME
ncbi:MAG: adenylate/guanylate cyclase domain-containing protein [Thermoproteota archaeon]|nr:adenylate/guanylate cyclase domain-containing protein [Thermoproteota archaeon]